MFKQLYTDNKNTGEQQRSVVRFKFSLADFVWYKNENIHRKK